jgi:hypothetical protein
MREREDLQCKKDGSKLGDVELSQAELLPSGVHGLLETPLCN